MKRGIIAWLLISIVLLGSQIGLAIHHRQQRQAVAQASYDYGKSVGNLQGKCELFELWVKVMAGTDWAERQEVADALRSCRAFQASHAPGTTERIQL